MTLRAPGDRDATRDPWETGSRLAFFFLVAGLILFMAPGPLPLSAEESLAGQLLVARPSLGDPRFQETVILLVQHDTEGAMGLVVNRPLGRVPLAVILRRFDQPGEGEGERRPGERGKGGETDEEAPGEGVQPGPLLTLFYGGPVAGYQGFVLHSPDVLLPQSLKVNSDYALTTHLEMLRRIGRGEGPAQVVFAMGYAGWAPGQLEAELKRQAWDVIPAEPSLVFAEDPARTWEQAHARRGVDL